MRRRGKLEEERMGMGVPRTASWRVGNALGSFRFEGAMIGIVGIVKVSFVWMSWCFSYTFQRLECWGE